MDQKHYVTKENKPFHKYLYMEVFLFYFITRANFIYSLEAPLFVCFYHVLVLCVVCSYWNVLNVVLDPKHCIQIITKENKILHRYLYTEVVFFITRANFVYKVEYW